MSVKGSSNSKKIRFLGKRTLNPKPEQVTDELFLTHDFFDAQDLLQVKYEMVRRVVKDGWTVSKAIRTFGFSRPTFYETQKTLVQEGIAGLVPRKKGPKEGHKLTAGVMEYVAQLLGRKERLSTPEILVRVEKHCGVTVHRRSMERALDRWKKKR